MTMKYAHIGIEDQAKALAALPAPKKCQHIVSKRGVLDGPEIAQDGTDEHNRGKVATKKTPQNTAPNDRACQQMAAHAENEKDRGMQVQFPPPPSLLHRRHALPSTDMKRRKPRFFRGFFCFAPACDCDFWSQPVSGMAESLEVRLTEAASSKLTHLEFLELALTGWNASIREATRVTS